MCRLDIAVPPDLSEEVVPSRDVIAM